LPHGAAEGWNAMVIPPDLPRYVAPARPGALQTLALQSGQVLDAKVVGPAANGGTQVEIRGQVLNLVLPTLVQAGQTIRLEVQGAGQQMRLALQQAVAPLPQAISPAPGALPPEVSLPLPNPTVSPSPTPAGTSPVPTQVVQGQQTVILPQAAVTEAGTPTPSQQTAQSANAAATPQSAQAAPTGSALANGQATNAPSANATQTPATQTPGASAPTPTTVATTTVVTTTVTTPTPSTIYPQTNSANPNPLAVAAAGAAATPSAAPAARAAPLVVAPVTPALAVGSATTQASSGNPLPQPPPQPATPQAVLTQMVQTSIPSQGAVTGLTTALASIAGKVVLPEPVVRAAQQVLAGRVAIDAPRFDGAALQAAIKGSGVFQEASLAHGLTQPQADMKSALLTLRQTLTTWLGQQAPVNAVAQLPPPLRGITPRARPSEGPPIDADATPEEVGRQLLERTESALARVRLHQHASLPDPVTKTADWSMDLPVMVGTHQTLMQLHIHGDPEGDAETGGERGWQMRFALSLPEMGEVGAQVTLRAGATGVMLWATEPSASAALEEEIASLRETLGDAGLRPGAVIVRHGEPPTPAVAAPSGHFVDEQR
jgi:hypothetical protein